MTNTTYLEMRSPVRRPVVCPVSNVTVQRLSQPTPQAYRQLYNGVGSDYGWVDRNRMTDDQLRRAIHDDRVEIHVLHVDGQAAGYCELDLRDPTDIELVYFGLFPQQQGRGLGKWFLNWTLDRAWSHGPQRLWLHTCEHDHAGALPLYLQAGFAIST